MIKKEEVFKIGVFNKPHGVKGELSFTFTDDIFDRVDCEYLICLLDGIMVPFFIEEMRTKNHDTMIVKIERMESADEVRFLTNRGAYIPREWVEESEELSWSYFHGFTAVDEKTGVIGTITDIDDSTINTLFVIEKNGEEILIPAQEEFITGIDHKKREIRFNLPEGLVSL